MIAVVKLPGAAALRSLSRNFVSPLTWAGDYRKGLGFEIEYLFLLSFQVKLSKTKY
jgi:hypothetical protein